MTHHYPPLHPDESEPIALNPLLRGVDLAFDRLIRRDCFTKRTLDILDELREELATESRDAMIERIARPLPDRDTIARTIRDAQAEWDHLDTDKDVWEHAADAVLSLFEEGS